MLYLGSSVLAVAKELELPVKELAIAGFLPSYSAYYDSKVFSLTNHICDCIENSLPGLFSARVKVSWEDDGISPSRNTLPSDINRLVLFQLCTFPTDLKGAFVAEYAIPQILTTALLEHGFCGLIFPSTKDYSELEHFHRFSMYHMNVGIFVPYDPKHDINKSLMNTFTGYTLDGAETFALTTQDVRQQMDKITVVTKRSAINNNDFLLPVVNLELHMKYLERSTVNGLPYFDTEYGKYELELCMHMLRHLFTCVR